MKFLIVLALIAFVAARPDDGSFYDSKYDNFDVDEMLGSSRLLKAYFLCFKGEGKCTAEGADFKKWIPEAVETSCGKCTDKQKRLIAKALKAIKTKNPQDYEALVDIYDAERKHKETTENFIKKYAP